LEEEEILDHENQPIDTTPYWPYILLGGAAAGLVKVIFAFMAPQTGFTVQIILLILLSMIMMNTTLNFYYQKNNSAKDLRSAIVLCIGVYVVMQALARLFLYMWGRYPNEFFDNWMVDVPASLAAGALISILVAILSKKTD
jgi:hypothetical protein